jgi:hypothetical protein
MESGGEGGDGLPRGEWLPLQGEPEWSRGTDRSRPGRRYQARAPQGRSTGQPHSVHVQRAGEIRDGPFISVWPERPESRLQLAGPSSALSPTRRHDVRLPPPTGVHSPPRTGPQGSLGVSWPAAPGPAGPASGLPLRCRRGSYGRFYSPGHRAEFVSPTAAVSSRSEQRELRAAALRSSATISCQEPHIVMGQEGGRAVAPSSPRRTRPPRSRTWSLAVQPGDPRHLLSRSGFRASSRSPKSSSHARLDHNVLPGPFAQAPSEDEIARANCAERFHEQCERRAFLLPICHHRNGTPSFAERPAQQRRRRFESMNCKNREFPPGCKPASSQQPENARPASGRQPDWHDAVLQAP